jgi:ectoine hydroxylase-related dioxygenase (phytanoyl-CoA dioxygenase family)
MSDQEKEAVHCWLLHQENQRDNLFQAFSEQWQKMTPAWFHDHLSDALDCLFAIKPD